MFSFIGSYFLWHFTKGLFSLLLHIKNFLWFLYHFFSIKILLQTLFSPWKLEGEGYKRGFSIENFFETFIVNTLMRIVGFLIRISVIIVGFICIATASLASVPLVAIWIGAPILIPFVFISGLRMIL